MYLEQPITAGRLKLKNRLVMPPMATAKSDAEGRVTQVLLDYYDEKTRDGCFSLVIVEHSAISQQGRASAGQLSAADDGAVPGLSELSALIHRNGSRTVMQLNHAGSAAVSKVTGLPVAGPSPVPNPSKGDAEPPEALSADQIRAVVGDFRKAALRVRAAGFDGVEIHSAHGYLLDQFLSPLSNRRTDEYGGKIENRIRIHLEVIRAVREAVGEDFPVLLRMGATDGTEDGLSVEDAQKAAAAFERAGVCLIDISGGMCRYELPGAAGPGYFAPYSGAVKKAVSVPVLVTGGITRAAEAEKVLRSGNADLIGVGRAVLRDSGWTKNALESLKK